MYHHARRQADHRAVSRRFVPLERRGKPCDGQLWRQGEVSEKGKKFVVGRVDGISL